MVEVLERLGCTVEFRARADLLRSDARQHRLPRRGAALVGASRGVFAGAEASSRRRPPAPRTCAAARARAAAVHELSEFLVDVLGVDDVGARFPHRVAYHPTCHSLRELQRRRRARCGCCAVRDIELVELAEADLLRVRRHLRGQEPRRLDGDARRQDATASTRRGAEICTAVDNSCLMHIGGGLRRRGRPSGRCTSPRSWRRREHGGVARRASQRGPRRAAATPSCGATSAQATKTIRGKRLAAVVAELPDWEELREAGRAIKDRTLRSPRPAPGELERRVHRGRRHRPLGARRRRGERDRRRHRAPRTAPPRWSR